ncbi:MAG: DNA-binding response regulator [Bdellovibrionaceae bacterium]|nr:DNA-binding response regulator [Pseudobdellovibrionaceae bacterium]|tara:strand:- start:4457 stop:5134 length:678 start_codon:yes stop_codon:yes gene_type:complete
MKRVLLLEDDQSLGQTLEERLHREGFEVIRAMSLEEGRSHLSKHFDLFILDVGLPDGSGFDFAHEITAQKNAPFLFMTAQSDAESRLKGYEAGATEFIPKPFHLREFLIRVSHVMENHITPHVLELDEEVAVDFDSFKVHRSDQSHDLTQKEALVLKVLVEASPRVISRDVLLDRVWGQEAYPSQRTVDNVILKLRQVLGEPSGKNIQSVRGVGYKWIGQIREKK